MMQFQVGRIVQNQYSEARKSVEHSQTPGLPPQRLILNYVKSE